MANMKTEFELEMANGFPGFGKVFIIGTRPKYRPYIKFEIEGSSDVTSFYINDNDMERFAVNILKALKSKHLNP